ncbi:hypothetical protein DM02DRAFT_684399 [Periconia macrospinosa]|uniref:Uncharacterized protein n=1 Tax=Periconia macrospinosa TaxID=97972 RepID=A0A2V1DHS9_9PLEO|nr:hypothetical protein DM02DRAFT_684399 [Periconia macrospinosa]
MTQLFTTTNDYLEDKRENFSNVNVLAYIGLQLTPYRKLLADQASQPSPLCYQADKDEEVTFTYNVPVRTVLVGPGIVTIDISSSSPDHLDVYAHVSKANKNGDILPHQNIPIPETLSVKDEAHPHPKSTHPQLRPYRHAACFTTACFCREIRQDVGFSCGQRGSFSRQERRSDLWLIPIFRGN